MQSYCQVFKHASLWSSQEALQGKHTKETLPTNHPQLVKYGKLSWFRRKQAGEV